MPEAARIRTLDTAAAFVALAATLGLFLWLNVPILRHGLRTQDDAFFAVVARSMADGRGYGAPQSSDTFLPFDPDISTGPTLVVPVALAIWFAGPIDWLPGAIALLVFLVQLGLTLALLSRRVGWAASTGFTAMALLLVTLLSLRWWYFASFFGEPVSFGFICLGLAFLCARDRTIPAGLCFSAAVTTKLIALVPVAGILTAWLWGRCRGTQQVRAIARDALRMAVAVAAMPLLFELAKLVTLGWSGYWDLFHSAAQITSRSALALEEWSATSRLAAARTGLLEYVPLPRQAAVVVAVSLGLLWILRRRSADDAVAVSRLATALWAGAAFELLFVIAISIVWEGRYLWMGLALACVGVAAPMLVVGPRLRLVLTAGAAIWVVASGAADSLAAVHADHEARADIAVRDRHAVLQTVEARPALPMVAFEWVSMADVLFLRKASGPWACAEPSWACEPELERFRPEPFLGLVHREFANDTIAFNRVVVSFCDALPGGDVHRVYLCGLAFWNHWPAVRSVADPR